MVLELSERSHRISPRTDKNMGCELMAVRKSRKHVARGPQTLKKFVPMATLTGSSFITEKHETMSTSLISPTIAPKTQTRKQASRTNLRKARRAKQRKSHARRAAGSRRTKVAQSLKKQGVSLDVGFTGKVTITPKGPKKRPSFLATEKMDIVISPRGRGMTKGVTDPLAKPPKDMPQSKQDYFLISRAIRHAAYDYQNKTLELIFETGSKYHFYNVPYSTWNNFKMAQSKGRFFMQQIYGYWTGPKGSMVYHPNYEYQRMR